MHVVSLAAGAGNMVCGSCIRDNRVAATLLTMGKSVSLLPLYTPLRTDEENVSRSRVYFGGLTVYLRQLGLQRIPKWLVSILESKSLLSILSRFSSTVRPESLGPLTVSVLRGADGPMRQEIFRLVETLHAIKPDLINLPDLLLIALAEPIRQSLRVPIVCTLSGEDIFLDRLPQPHRRHAFELIAHHARAVDRFVAVTTYFADHAARHFRLPRERIEVVPLGISVEDFQTAAPNQPPPFTVGYLARICPEKGLANLLDALIRLSREGRSLRVQAAGYLAAADRGYLKNLMRRLKMHGLSDRFEYLGEISRSAKVRFLRGLHAFSVPTVYKEAKGIYLLEAMASALPVVQPAHGSFPELIEATGGGLLYDPTDPRGLDIHLLRLMEDADLRQALGRQGQAAVREKFNDRQMAQRTWALYESLVTSR